MHQKWNRPLPEKLLGQIFTLGVESHDDLCDGLVWLLHGLVSQGLELAKIHWIETEDHRVYRRQGDQWQMRAPEVESQKVSDEIAAHFDLVEEAAATYKSSGRVQ